ncbi:MAG: histidine--tRNA ligase [Opitutae bacterium]|nr:histidine--tRNA ligase [Opitutae bacterium]MCD8299155.1 histidine--tRNA ligase [Opitutae bacterium]
MATFKSLPGFRDFYPEDCAIRNYTFSTWREVAHSFSFQEWDAPVLESLELFTEKSGEEIVSQLFNFEDKGGRKVSLRPEMTPSLARLVAARAGTLRRPIKWFGIGENYRYEKQQRGRLRAFYQYNADILGEPGVSADAEIISLCVESLRAFGLEKEDFCIRLSDRTLWFLFLAEIGIADESLAVKVLSVVDKFERVSPEALSEMMANALAGTGLDPAATLEKIRAFLGISNFAQLKELFGGNERLAPRLADWENLLALLEALNAAQFVRVDLTIVRGLAYYTGFVFEAFQLVGTGRALAGGGRYDKLVQKLGGPAIPAVGFGMGDVTLRNILEEKKLLPRVRFAPDFYAIILGEENRAAALRDISNIRSGKLVRIEYSFKSGKFGKLIQTAEQSGARYVLIYGSNEVSCGLVKIRDTIERREVAFPSKNLFGTLMDILDNGLPEVDETPAACRGDGNCANCTCGARDNNADDDAERNA